MINIEKGRYWDLPWSLVSGCAPISPGCLNCWSANITHRFRGPSLKRRIGPDDVALTDNHGRFTGGVILHEERLHIPLKRKKPTVFAIWNDLFFRSVTVAFIDHVLDVAAACPLHTFLALTKRSKSIDDKLYGVTENNPCRSLGGGDYLPNLWVGVTVCNQDEADKKIPALVNQWPGPRFISIEPCLGPISLRWITPTREWYLRKLASGSVDEYDGLRELSGVIMGGETGPGARPTHPDWVRTIRDQCASACVPFFFKQWGEWAQCDNEHLLCRGHKQTVILPDGTSPKKGRNWENIPGAVPMYRAGRKVAGRILDGCTYDDLPWRLPF